MTVGEKIKKHRKALGLTQTELGVKLGVQKNAVSKWECGRVDDIPNSKIKALASLFDVSASYLIDEEEPTLEIEGGLDELELQLMDFVRGLTDDQKQFLLAQLRTLTENQK